MKIDDGKNYLSEVKELIKEYLVRFGRGLSFQNIEDELNYPSHKYTASEGEILVVLDNGKDFGIGAYYRHSNECCEMKRLYVCLEARGMHLGSKLIAEIIQHARKARYKEMVLDTIEPLKTAIFA